jgi:hypothetical protein
MHIPEMTRAKANEILTFWKLGLESYPRAVINLALYVTGDLESPL